MCEIVVSGASRQARALGKDLLTPVGVVCEKMETQVEAVYTTLMCASGIRLQGTQEFRLRGAQEMRAVWAKRY